MDRKHHWEKVYRDRPAAETSWHQAAPRLSLSMIGRAGIKAEDALIDIGGGASLLVDHLLDRGFSRVSVLDLSGAALQQARQRLGERARRVDWIEADVCDFCPDTVYRLWHDRAAFHFLTAAGDREKYVRNLRRALAPGGQAVIATFAPAGPPKCSGLDIVRYDSEGLMAELGPGFRLEEQAGEIHLTPAGREQAFNYFRLERVG